MQNLEEINLRYLRENFQDKILEELHSYITIQRDTRKKYSLLSLFLNSISTNVIIYTRETTETKK